MRNYIFKSILLIILSLFCQDTSAIGLTEFTKQLIDLYTGTYKIPNTEDIVVHTNTDTLCYKAFLYSIDPDVPLSGAEYIGKVKHNDRFVYLFGKQNGIFHTGKKVGKSDLKSSKKNDDMIVLFDPIEWGIFIDKKDLKLNKQLTNTNIVVCLQDGKFVTDMDSATLVQLERIVNAYCGK